MSSLKDIFNDLVDAEEQKERIALPSQWAATNRVLSGVQSSYPGRWRNDFLPYLVPIMDFFARDNRNVIGTNEEQNFTTIVVLKGSRMGVTTAMVNVMGWYIDQQPTAIRYLVANQSTLKDVFDVQVEVMLTECGLLDKIVSPRKKDSGNTKFAKHFFGGSLHGGSLNTLASRTSYTAKVIVADELDEVSISAREGLELEVQERSITYGNAARLAFFSKPGDAETSTTLELFNKSNQCYWHVMCPDCNERFRLRWQDDEGNFCFVYDTTDDGHYVMGSAAAICSHCKAKIGQKALPWMNERGKFIPSVVGINPRYLGLQLCGLATRQRDWDDVCITWIAAKGDIFSTRAFIKSILGEPHVEKLPEQAYRNWWVANTSTLVEVSHDFRWSDDQLASIKLITMGVDIQDGWLEAQVVGFTDQITAYDLHHFQIHGKDYAPADVVVDPMSLTSFALSELQRRLQENDWVGCPYLGQGDSVAKMDDRFSGLATPHVVFVDSGYQPALVYEFCKSIRPRLVAASRGVESFVDGTFIKHDEKSGSKLGLIKVQLNTFLLKQELYNSIANSRIEENFVHILPHRDDKYKRGFLSEKLEQKGAKMAWTKIERRNEVLDCWVMARAAMYFFATDGCENAPDWQGVFG
jgi:phage terminase large subunit GpA-like protein